MIIIFFFFTVNMTRLQIPQEIYFWVSGKAFPGLPEKTCLSSEWDHPIGWSLKLSKQGERKKPAKPQHSPPLPLNRGTM